MLIIIILRRWYYERFYIFGNFYLILYLVKIFLYFKRGEGMREVGYVFFVNFGFIGNLLRYMYLRLFYDFRGMR